MADDVDQVTVIPNLTVAGNREDEMTVPPRTNDSVRSDERRRRAETNQYSRRDVRVGQSVNFCLYGITLMIPGISMIIVYFVVFRIPSGNIKWSPADAFVITGAILVGFSIVSEVIALWQFCMSRYESDELQPHIPTRRNPYSDAPPPYDGIGIELPDVVVASVSLHSTGENPPSFESCYPNLRSLPGLENCAFDSISESEDFPPPPDYVEVINQKEQEDATQSQSDVITMDEVTGTVRIVTSRSPENKSKKKKSPSKRAKDG